MPRTDRALSMASAVPRPANFRYTADSVTQIVFRWRFTDSAYSDTDADIKTVLDSTVQRYAVESGGRFKFKYELRAGAWTFNKTVKGYNDWHSWYAWVKDQLKAAGLEKPWIPTIGGSRT